VVNIYNTDELLLPLLVTKYRL